MLAHVDLCSGIGGFALAARWAGIETVGFCEIEDFPRRVLAKNFPGVPQHDDIKTLSAHDVLGWAGGRRFVLTAGYPCQPFSAAGKRAGTDDPRHLWPYIRALVDGARPDWIVFENVRGHVSLGLDAVLSDLEELGYAGGAFVVSAKSVGAVHPRDRLWIVAADADEGGRGTPERSLLSGESDAGWGGSDAADAGRRGCDRRTFVEGAFAAERRGTCGHGGTDAADAERDGPQGVEQGWSAARPTVGDRTDDRRADGGEARSAESGVRRADDGVPAGMDGPYRHLGSGDWRAWDVPATLASVPGRVGRLKALGNAIVPQIAYEIMRSIVTAEGEWA